MEEGAATTGSPALLLVHSKVIGINRNHRSESVGISDRNESESVIGIRRNPHPRFHLHFTPTSASWLNQVERWFAEITNKRIRRGSYRSTRELERAIEDYLSVYNDDPKPFIWTKSADDILESLKRYCESISDTGH